jgi:hypothetical protein
VLLPRVRQVATCGMNETVIGIMARTTAFRHLPVVEESRLPASYRSAT